jgi:hypothetical protein
VDPRDIVRLEGLGQFKNPITSSRIESVIIFSIVMFDRWLKTGNPKEKKHTKRLITLQEEN